MEGEGERRERRYVGRWMDGWRREGGRGERMRRVSGGGEVSGFFVCGEGGRKGTRE